MALSTPNFRPNRQPFRANNQGRKFLGPTYWTHNGRGFCGDQSCSFQHKCGYCRGAHPAQSCGQQGRRQPMGVKPRQSMFTNHNSQPCESLKLPIHHQQQNSGQINLTHSLVPPICTPVKFGKPKTLLQGYPAKKKHFRGFSVRFSPSLLRPSCGYERTEFKIMSGLSRHCSSKNHLRNKHRSSQGPFLPPTFYQL